MSRVVVPGGAGRTGDAVHVCDLADAHAAALTRLGDGGPSGYYNLGNGEGMSVRQVLDAVGRVVGRPVPHTVGARRPGDPARLVAGSSRATHDLGGTPRFADLDTIVGRVWRWHQAFPGGYGPGAEQAR